MTKRVPHYYKKFQCIASECKDNCCTGGWEIDIDDDMAEYYLKLQGPFGDRLRTSIIRNDADEYCFRLKDGCCPFLNSDHLCGIYQQLGEDKMGVVCTQFPRYTEYFGNIKETGIGLACEEAARIILCDQETFSMEAEGCEEEVTADSEYDDVLASQLFLVRDCLLELMEDQTFSFPEKLMILFRLCNDIQKAVNNNQYEALTDICNTKYELFGTAAYEETEISVQEGIERILCAYMELEPLNDQWTNTMEHVFEVLHPQTPDTLNNQAYIALTQEFHLCVQEREAECLNLMKYFIFRYFMKAVYDHDVLGKAQMAVTAFFVLRDMEITRWLDNQRVFSFQDRMDILHIFSREVEYSEDNMEDLSEEFLFDDIFKTENLISLLGRTIFVH